MSFFLCGPIPTGTCDGTINTGTQIGSGQSVNQSTVQPILSDDVVAALADVTLGAPLNGTLEVAGPEQIRLDELIRTDPTRRIAQESPQRLTGHFVPVHTNWS